MAELKPLDFRLHLENILEEFKAYGTIYGYDARYFFQPDSAFDFSVNLYGKKAATPLGPAAGPHTQLAQNIVLGWLHGSRIIELKTIQVLDDLDIPRPCIDMRNVGYNVEWSQELSLDESFREYASAWALIHVLQNYGIFKAPPGDPFYDTVFDMSAGYDLKGISSPSVSRWLKNMADARELIAALLDTLPAHYDRLKNISIPAQISDSITLSTFHGCPADEIEEIVRYLITEQNLNVVVKMNPTLAGYEFTKNLLQNIAGYKHIELLPEAFESDLNFEQAIPMMRRLRQLAEEKGRTVGVKFTNTLIVKNSESFFDGPERYLSGAPLYMLAMHLVQRFRETAGNRFPVSFSGGIDKNNFSEAVSCGLAPVTTCTDLLKKGGYRKLFYYLDTLKKEAREKGVGTIDEFIIANSGSAAGSVEMAALQNSVRIAEQAQQNPAYRFQQNKTTPKKIDSHLTRFDCLSCAICIPVCPNAANFSFRTGKTDEALFDYEIKNGVVHKISAGRFILQKETQIGTIAEFCNACGNCDTFCPELGGPFKQKSRFFLYESTWAASPRQDGFYFSAPNTMRVRFEGSEFTLFWNAGKNQWEWSGKNWKFIITASGAAKLSGDAGTKIDGQRFYAAKAIFNAVRSEPEKYPNFLFLASKKES